MSLIISGPEDLEELAGKSPLQLLSQASRMRPSSRLAVPMRKTVSKLASVAKAVNRTAGSITAWLARQPTVVCGITDEVAAATTVSNYSLTPGNGQSYSIVSILASDSAINAFGVSSFKIGGVEHVYSTWTGGTVGNNGFAPLAQFSTRDPKQYGLQPWSGRWFVANTPITLTARNVSAAAVVLSLSVACQTQQCAQYSGIDSSASAAYRKNVLSRQFASAFGRGR